MGGESFGEKDLTLREKTVALLNIEASNPGSHPIQSVQLWRKWEESHLERRIWHLISEPSSKQHWGVFHHFFWIHSHHHLSVLWILFDLLNFVQAASIWLNCEWSSVVRVASRQGTKKRSSTSSQLPWMIDLTKWTAWWNRIWILCFFSHLFSFAIIIQTELDWRN